MTVPDSSDGDPAPARRPGALVVVIVLVFAEAAMLVAAAAVLIVDVLTGPPAELGSGIALTVLVLVLAGGLALAGRALLLGLHWPRAAVVMWQLLTLTVAIPTALDGRPAVGVALMIPAVVICVGLFMPGVIAATSKKASDLHSGDGSSGRMY
ncbi:hypothetical protein [Spelaeicoccus albus]|uniref:Integral membrane protein n=1 Tax=Spelaeicoccus albus TaxID=1280376 RepID=A0A7Z0D5H1_9MICO|nr:hypothetical protein [Spelaeicoccus albus]NYI69269.1 hypothetical protein [Spelaeicoccus albus]